MERSILELWLIVEKCFDNYFDGCLCDVLIDLNDDHLITNDEYITLKRIIDDYGISRGFIKHYGQREYFWKADLVILLRLFLLFLCIRRSLDAYNDF